MAIMASSTSNCKDEETESTESDIKVAKPTEPKITPLKPWQLFRFADRADVCMILVGAVFAVGSGLTLPCIAVITSGLGSATGSLEESTTSSDPVSTLEKTRPVLIYFALITVAIVVTNCVSHIAFSLTSERQISALRKAYLEAVLRKDMSWFDTNNVAELPTRMTSQARAVQDAMAVTGRLIQGMTQTFFSILLAFFQGPAGWKMTLVTSSPCVLIITAAVWKAKFIPRGTLQQQAGYDSAGAVAEEILGAMRTVASFGAEAAEARRFERHLGPARRAGILTAMHLGTIFALVLGGMNAMYPVGIVFGVSHPGLSSDHILVIMCCFIFTIFGLLKTGEPLAKWMTALLTAATIFQVLDEVPAIEPHLEEKAGDEVGTILEVTFEDVHFSYPARPDDPVLRGLSLTFRRGQKLGLVGESGSGKSTIMQLLERFYDPDRGQVTVNGTPLRSLQLAWWRRQIGYVGQEPVLLAASVRDCITNGDAATEDDRVVEVAKLAHAYDFISALPMGFDTLVDGGQLSGGQKQRIAIARALIRCPQILLLDEATSALDSVSEHEVQSSIDGITAGGGGIVPGLMTISIAHRLSTIRDSDMIFLIRDGCVAERGTHEELMAQRSGYFGLVRAQELVVAASSEAEETEAVAFEGCAAPVCPSSSHGSGPTLLENRDMSYQEPSNSNYCSASLTATTVPEEPKPQPKEEQAEPEDPYKAPAKRVMRMAKPEWPLFPVAFASCVLAGVVAPFQGLILGELVGALYGYEGDERAERAIALSLWYLVSAACYLVGESVKAGIFGYIQETLSLRIRVQTFKALMRQDIGFFDDPANNAAGFATLLEVKSKQVALLAGKNFGNSLGALASIGGGLVLACMGSWRIVLLELGLLPLLFIAVRVLMKDTEKGLFAKGDAYGEAGAISSEAITKIRTVRSLQSERHLMLGYGRVVDRIVSAVADWRLFRSGLIFGLCNAVIWPMFIAAFQYGAWLIDEGLTTQAGVFQALLCLINGLIGGAGAVAFGPDLAEGRLAARDVFGLLDRKSKMDTADGKGKHRSLGDGTIAFESVRFHYPHRQQVRVLRGLSFSVEPGQNVALVGPSGSGKSTIIQLLQRFYDPAEGRVLVGGVCLTRFDLGWWRRQVAMVGQEPVLFSLSLEDNVKYGKPEATRAEVEEVARKADMDFALSGRVPWEALLGLKGGRLSGGQKQRCAVARAMLRNPSVLLLDEATSALDSASEREVQRALDVARQGRTTFTVAHRLSTIQDSDSILVISDGVLVEQGTHAQLMAQQRVYYQLAQQLDSRGPDGNPKASPAGALDTP